MVQFCFLGLDLFHYLDHGIEIRCNDVGQGFLVDLLGHLLDVGQFLYIRQQSVCYG